MKKYLTFEEVARRVRYGTELRVSGEFSNDVYWDGVWASTDKVCKFDKSLLMAEVASFSISGEALEVKVVKQN